MKTTKKLKLDVGENLKTKDFVLNKNIQYVTSFFFEREMRDMVSYWMICMAFIISD